MYEMGKARYKMDEQTEEQKQARLRMALFPKDSEVLFVQEDLCVTPLRKSSSERPLTFLPQLGARRARRRQSLHLARRPSPV